jgi:hypothetical protein
MIYIYMKIGLTTSDETVGDKVVIRKVLAYVFVISWLIDKIILMYLNKS